MPNINFGAIFVFFIVIGIVLAQFLPWAFRMLGRLLIWLGGVMT